MHANVYDVGVNGETKQEYPVPNGLYQIGPPRAVE